MMTNCWNIFFENSAKKTRDAGGVLICSKA